MIECVPKDIRRRGHWKHEYFTYCDDIHCSMFFEEAEQRKKTKNHRVYSGQVLMVVQMTRSQSM